MLLASLGAFGPGTPNSAAETPQHWLNAGVMPPGAIGKQRLLRGGPLSGYMQPVELRTPSGVSVAASGSYGEPTLRSERLKVGLQVGLVYRFRADAEVHGRSVVVYPSVEVIDRTYPPCGRENEFPLPIELTPEDIRLAAEGAFVTRIIYVEDPKTALPVSEKKIGGQQWFEARPGDDPMVLAEGLGRPVAILRIGARDTGVLAEGFYAEPVPLATRQQDHQLKQAAGHE